MSLSQKAILFLGEVLDAGCDHSKLCQVAWGSPKKLPTSEGASSCPFDPGEGSLRSPELRVMASLPGLCSHFLPSKPETWLTSCPVQSAHSPLLTSSCCYRPGLHAGKVLIPLKATLPSSRSTPIHPSPVPTMPGWLPWLSQDQFGVLPSCCFRKWVSGDTLVFPWGPRRQDLGNPCSET